MRREKSQRLTIDQHRELASLLAMCDYCQKQVSKQISGTDNKASKYSSALNASIYGLRMRLECVLCEDNPKNFAIAGPEFYFGHPEVTNTGLFGDFLTVAKNDPLFIQALAAYFDQENS